VAGLAALVARRFLREPRLVSLIVPLWTRLTRAGRRFERLMTRVAAKRLPKLRPTRPGPTRPHRGTPDAARPPALPAGHGWLVRALSHEGVAYASQLEFLLAERATIDLLAACPQATRILGPLGRMLGLAAFARKRRPPKPRPQAATPRAAKPNPFDRRQHADPDYRPSADWPRGPWPKRRPPTPWFLALQQRRAEPA
jgi:hypothetical protein